MADKAQEQLKPKAKALSGSSARVREPSRGQEAALSQVPPIVREVLNASGEPLDPRLRQDMGTRFGHDFSQVRVHSDTRAAESTWAVNALAYTVGRDIVFGPGQYLPHSSAGHKLLAHELAHVVQQSRGGEVPPLNRHSPFEQEAESAASALISGDQEVPVVGASAPGLARETNPPGSQPSTQAATANYATVETAYEKAGVKMVRIRVSGVVGDPILRPGLEKKYPEPGKVGLSGYHRWHLAGPNATGAESGIVYAPGNFNISETAEVENIIRKARQVTKEQGGKVYFDFTAVCREQGDYEGVQIRVLESVTWKAEVRAAGSDKFVPILNRKKGVTGAVSPTPQGQSQPSPAAPVAASKTKQPAAQPAKPAAQVTQPSVKPPKSEAPPVAGTAAAPAQQAGKVATKSQAGKELPEAAEGAEKPSASGLKAPKITVPSLERLSSALKGKVGAAARKIYPETGSELEGEGRTKGGGRPTAGGKGGGGRLGLFVALGQIAEEYYQEYTKEERQKELEQEIESRVTAKLAGLRPKLETLLEQSPKGIYAHIQVAIDETIFGKRELINVDVDLDTQGGK